MEPSCCPRYCTQSGPCISWESVCGRGQSCNQILVCEVLFFSTLLQIHNQHSLENVSRIRAKESKTRSLICKVNLNFFLRHFTFITISAVIVSFLNESVHGFNSIRNGRVKTKFQIVELWRLWKSLVKKQIFPPWHFGTLMVRIFLKFQPTFDLPDSAALENFF